MERISKLLAATARLAVPATSANPLTSVETRLSINVNPGMNRVTAVSDTPKLAKSLKFKDMSAIIDH